jgi:hypothetical protein
MTRLQRANLLAICFSLVFMIIISTIISQDHSEKRMYVGWVDLKGDTTYFSQSKDSIWIQHASPYLQDTLWKNSSINLFIYDVRKPNYLK